jgi:CheY-like chemotaxis protein
MRAKLERAGKLELIGAIAGGVAHDLNNMLGAILGYPDILLPDLSPDDPVYKPLVAMQKSAERAAEVVQDLLTLARRGVVQKDVLCLNDVVRQYLDSPELDMIRRQHPHAVLESTLAPDLLCVRGSATHLSKMLMNLVNNACEALKQSGRVMIATRNQYIDDAIEASETVAEGDYVVLRIEDTGIGITATDIERIFEPFYTTKKMGRSGTGLGMSVVWGTVKDHDGYITVDSRLGLGSAFEIYLPAVRETVAAPPTEQLDDIFGHGEQVLVIDDVELQRDVAASMLASLNYVVLKAAGGEEAIEMLKNRRVDLLILDMIMPPGIDGLETYGRILRLHPGQRALITSGYSETDRVRETQRLGAGGYLKKPFTRRALGRAVKAVLAGV